MAQQFDVVIAGGGLAGLTLARQIRREHPSLSVAVVEKTTRPLPDAGHKVGESSVELGSQYLERLGLKNYLLDRHLIKFGLRFFPGGGHLPLAQRVEIGPINQPVVSSYQMDRGRLESDLRGLIVDEDGATLLEGTAVKDIDLAPEDGMHTITVDREGERETLEARWVVDATGRAGLLRGRLKLKRGGRHQAHAGWFRVAGRVDINNMAEGADAERFHQVPEGQDRWLSTNHLMGEGYWVWVIPLATGHTSIGVVVHDQVHGFEEVRTLASVQAFLEKHEPHLARFLAEREIIDFGCLKGYCHTVSRCWHPDRWALVGEAGAFTDPLYSPGTDYIAFANSFTSELIGVDLAQGDVLKRSQELNAQYRALVAGSIGVYRHAAPVYGHPTAMGTKVFWDNHVYWSYPCQFYLQDIYRLSGRALEPFTYIGARFVELSNRMQQVLAFWARALPASWEGRAEGEMVVIPAFPSMLVDSHCALNRKMSIDETFEYMRDQLVLAEALFSELLLRVTVELGPILGRKMWEELEAKSWEFEITPERVACERLEGRARRRALPAMARDVERALGVPADRGWSVRDVASWLGMAEAEVA